MRNTTCSRLKVFRKNKYKTQVELAKIIGVHVNTYQLYESGKLDLPVKYAKTLGEYFGVDWWLLYED